MHKTIKKSPIPVSHRFVKRVLSDPQYRGKHLILIADKVFASSSAKQASRLFDLAIQKFPNNQPLLTYIPKADTLIAPVGFLNNEDVPPLLGRQNCLEVFRVILDKHQTTFISH